MHHDQLSEQQARAGLEEALSRLHRLDLPLLAVEVHEVTVTSRLAHHLAAVLEAPESHLRVDCEYNRDDAAPKRLDGVLLRPDVIVHERRTNKNHLIVECKKAGRLWGTRAEDVSRLLRMLEPPFFYSWAAYAELGTDGVSLWWGRDELCAFLDADSP